MEGGGGRWGAVGSKSPHQNALPQPACPPTPSDRLTADPHCSLPGERSTTLRLTLPCSYPYAYPYPYAGSVPYQWDEIHKIIETRSVSVVGVFVPVSSPSPGLYHLLDHPHQTVPPVSPTCVTRLP